MIPRLYIALGAFALIGSLLAVIWWQAGRNAELRAERDAATSTIETSEEFNDATDNPDGLSWRERLLGNAAD